MFILTWVERKKHINPGHCVDASQFLRFQDKYCRTDHHKAHGHKGFSCTGHLVEPHDFIQSLFLLPITIQDGCNVNKSA